MSALRLLFGVALLALAVSATGCSDEEEFLGGTARLTVVNEGSGYVDGTIDADRRYSYDVDAYSEETYGLAVGEGVLNYTNVVIIAQIHATSDPGSAIVASDTEKIRMSEGKSYEYVIPYGGGAGVLRERDGRSPSSITGP